jgi:hypothetical protein
VISDLNILDNYQLISGFEKIEEYYAGTPLKTLYILSRGFDPRMCESVVKLHACIAEMDILLLRNDEGHHSFSEEYSDLVKKNLSKLEELKCAVNNLDIKSNANLLSLFRETFNFSQLNSEYGRIIVDISSMPQSIFINLINYMIKESEKQGAIKLDIVACENSELDDAIFPTGLSDSAKPLIGFDTFSSDLESDENPISVLIPLLGKSCKEELEKLFSSLSPIEICPVLPFPSKNPRRSDEILSTLGRSLFESFSVETSNIVYVAEQNVFDVYIKLFDTIKHYQKVLSIIGNPRFYISIGSSKLIGLGALLASRELRNQEITVAFATVENSGYRFDIDKYKSKNNLICCLCLNNGSYGW